MHMPDGIAAVPGHEDVTVGGRDFACLHFLAERAAREQIHVARAVVPSKRVPKRSFAELGECACIRARGWTDLDSHSPN